MKRLISTLLVVTMLASCATMRPVDTGNSGTIANQVHAGDTVKVTTRDGRANRFVVTEVTGDAIVGQNVSIPQSDIASLQVMQKNRSSGKIAVAILLGVGVAALLSAAFDGLGAVAGGDGY